jgi:tetratricopeptide (TPR) repeat protein
VTFARKAATRLVKLLRAPGVLDSDRSEAAGDYTNLALVHNNLHLYREAASYAQRAVEIARPIPSARRHVSFGLGVLASSLRYQGDLSAALEAAEEAVRISEQITYRDNVQRMIALTGTLLPVGSILGEDGGVNLGRTEEAIEVLRKAFELSEEIARKEPLDAASRIRVGNIGEKLGNILRHYNSAKALAVYDAAIQRLGEAPHDVRSRQDQALVLADSSYAFRSLHRPREAQERIDRALAILKDTKDYPADRVPIDSPVFVVLRAAADQVAETTGRERAVELYEKLIAHVMAAELSAIQDDLRNAPRWSLLYESLGRLYRRIGNVPKAEVITARKLALWQYWDQKLPGNAFVRRQLAAMSAP